MKKNCKFVRQASCRAKSQDDATCIKCTMAGLAVAIKDLDEIASKIDETITHLKLAHSRLVILWIQLFPQAFDESERTFVQQFLKSLQDAES